MGGRRGGSLANLVGSGRSVTGAKRNLSRAVGSSDPKAIAEASAKLLAASELGLKGLLYGLRLAPFLEENASRLSNLPRLKREEEIRGAWARIKKSQELETAKEVDSVVVNAANSAFGKGGGAT